ncbi:hypothetical protein P7F88_25430 [Vibrio hannami]|uniref:hypothetical protein n=1 Tax=Vibrio hannami TaxID=2717094 RepID=UPI00240FB970|nr:hypothetical protein [Vibrio hannami]MDG3089208.1 hypothetical protein [Vibrio hannami]
MVLVKVYHDVHADKMVTQAKIADAVVAEMRKQLARNNPPATALEKERQRQVFAKGRAKRRRTTKDTDQ